MTSNSVEGSDILTDMGYKMLIDRIVNRTIVPPTDVGIKELNAWLNGYSECQNDILAIIESCMKGQRD